MIKKVNNMGRKKTSIDVNTVDQPENIPQEIDETSETQTTTPKGKTEEEVPQYVDEILKLYSEYEELYVSAKGGVYTVNTPEHIRKNAVLYKNKYFNT